MITRRSTMLALAASSSGFSAAPAIAQAPAVTLSNVVTLQDVSGSGSTNYPLRLGRPFIQGEMPSPPQVLVDGQPVPTQADVRTRWPDGSVQHAIMHLVVPRIPAGGKVSLTFRPQQGGAGPGLSAAAMLAPGFNFDAVIEISSNGETRAASARAMLEEGSYKVLSQGPVATSIILADHSEARRYDMGFDALRPIRPIFHATFWPGINQVHVRVIAENANTETLQDVAYDLVLKSGIEKKPFYQQAGMAHYLATRWSGNFWLGTAPEARININHNLAYLSQTRVFPSYDPTLSISEDLIAREYARWVTKPRTFFDAGNWMKYMPSAGGRDDLGPYPGWVIRWLYTGDHRLFEISTRMAELAGAWPLHIREGRAGKFFDQEKRVPGLGRVVSGYARPTAWVLDERDRSRPEDTVVLRGERITPQGQPRVKNGGWHSDGAHQPDPYSALYVLTGDPFMLEQMQLWAGTQTVRFNPNYKGPPGAGVIVEEVRGHAWVFRNRAHAAFLTPDGEPEKAYFTRLLEDAIACWEGIHGITGTRFEGSPCWRFGDSKPYRPPLHLWGETTNSRPDFWLVKEVPNATSFWQNYFVIFELSRARDLGFPTGPLHSWASVMLTSQFREPEQYSFFNVQRYWSPSRRPGGMFFEKWADTLDFYADKTVPTTINSDVSDGYAVYAYGAATTMVHEPGGDVAYAWLRQTLYEPLRARFPATPKWALVPRTS